MISESNQNKQANKQTRQKLIGAALPLFLEYGYNGVGTNQIITAAKLSKGAFYHHFSSKIELYEAAISDFFLKPLKDLDIEQLKNLPLKEVRKKLSAHYANLAHNIEQNNNIDMMRYYASYFEALSLLPDLRAKQQLLYQDLIDILSDKTYEEREIFPKVANAHAHNIISALEGKFLLNILLK